MSHSPAPNLAQRVLQEHIRPYFKLFSCAIACMVLVALTTAALPYLLQPVFDDVLTRGDTHKLMVLSGLVLGAFWIKGAASYGETVIMTYIGQKMISDIQKRLFSHLTQLDLSFFHSHATGAILSRLTNDVSLMRQSMSNAVVSLGKDMLTLVFLTAVMFYRDWTLSLIAFVAVPIAIAPIAKIGRRMRKVTHSNQDAVSRLTAHLSQVFQGMRVVKAYHQEALEYDRVKNYVDDIFRFTYKAARVRSIVHPIMEFLGGLAIIAVLAYGGWQVMNHARTTGEFVSFIGALLLLYEPLKRLSHLNTNIQEGLAAAGRVFEWIDLKATIQSPPTPCSLKKARGDVVFEKVSFSYLSGKQALSSINFHIQEGSCVAFVGPSGAGKSSLINLLPRFYDVTEGAILIDGMDIRSLSIRDLRSNIALVSQEISLFDGTVYENILYGAWDAHHDTILKAAHDAGVEVFIKDLPQGYDTIVGENGVMLSGGQRQRLAIARAMVKDAPILLLDEATSSLDGESERHVQRSLDRLMKGRTTFIVAHRLSTIQQADKIYVLDHGCIVEQGNHQELVIKEGLYAQLWKGMAA